MERDEDEGSQVIICQGPPRCPLTDEAAMEAALAGCLWCVRLHVDKDGNETIISQPGEA